LTCKPIEKDILSRVNSTIMKNMEMKIEGTVLTITVDLAKEFGESKSGKSIVIGSSEGNISIPDNDDIKIGLNVYRKKA
jgi:hypothetical protein